MKIELKTKRFLACPFCQRSDHEVEHLFAEPGRLAGPWYCDACGSGWMTTCFGDGRVECSPAKGAIRHVTATLEIQPQSKPIRFTAELTEFDTGGGFPSEADALEGHRYFVEEHTCPSNLFREAEDVHLGDEDDPHGLIVLISVAPKPTK